MTHFVSEREYDLMIDGRLVKSGWINGTTIANGDPKKVNKTTVGVLFA